MTIIVFFYSAPSSDQTFSSKNWLLKVTFFWFKNINKLPLAKECHSNQHACKKSIFGNVEVISIPRGLRLPSIFVARLFILQLVLPEKEWRILWCHVIIIITSRDTINNGYKGNGHSGHYNVAWMLKGIKCQMQLQILYLKPESETTRILICFCF